MDLEPVIALERVVFGWGRAPAVLDIDRLRIAPREKVFIKGPSGSGKSTLLALLGGVLKPRQGRICVLDTDLARLSGIRRDAFRAAHIGFIFQMFNLLPYLSVTENVMLPCRFSASRRRNALARSGQLLDEARRLLEHLGLGQETWRRPVLELSMGQQQRVAAARALIGHPEIIIADEPTSALDAEARGAFLQLLFKECELAGATLIFVSHDPALEPFFDRTLVMADFKLNGPAGRQERPWR